MEILIPPIKEEGHSIYAAWDELHSLFGVVIDSVDKYAVMSLFNQNDFSEKLSIDFSKITGLVQNKFHVWCFNDRYNSNAYRGIYKNSYISKIIPAHGNELLRLTPVAENNEPLLVGSDIHIGIGTAEIKKWSYCKSGKLQIVLTNAGARQGALWIAYGGEFKSIDALNCNVEFMHLQGSIWKVSIDSRHGDTQTIDMK